jgi:hypothetical protein
MTNGPGVMGTTLAKAGFSKYQHRKAINPQGFIN